MTPLTTLAYSDTRPQIAKVRYTHDAMIDLAIARPEIAQREIAAYFGYTEAWVSTIFASEAFQERMAERKGDLVDPALRATVDERIRALVMKSQAILLDRLATPGVSVDVALEVFKASSRAMGYGVAKPQLAVQNNFVVHVPAKSVDSATWEGEMREITGREA